MLASSPSQHLDQNSADLGILNRFNPDESDSKASKQARNTSHEALHKVGLEVAPHTNLHMTKLTESDRIIY